MQTTHPDLFGDLGDQILAAELRLGIRSPVDDCYGRREREKTVALPEFESVSAAELIEE